MTLRQTFLVLVAPLFLLLAGVNGALLYISERAEAAKGLEAQALAAAVTTAAFASAGDDLARVLSQPRRVQAFRAATASIRDLDGLYLARSGQAPRRIAGTGEKASLEGLARPRAPVALPIRADAAGYRVATALAPAGDDEYVIVQIDAEPLFAQVDGLKWLIVGVVVAAGLAGLLLAWGVGSRIRGELVRNSAMIAGIRADGPPPTVEGLTIRETRDLGQAVRLMQTSVAGRIARGDRELAAQDRRRGEAGAVSAYRQTAFPPLSATAAGMTLSVRMLGQAPPGAFYALCLQPNRAALVLSVCDGATPAEALARAVSARRYFERGPPDGDVTAHVERGRRAFALSRLAWREWSEFEAAGPRLSVLALLDGNNADRAATYGRRSSGLSADAVAADLAALLSANGVLAVLGVASAQDDEG